MPSTNKKILVVDDDPDFRRAIYPRLMQYDIFFAADGISALIEARKHEPNLIILDLGLPGGDGFFVMKGLRLIPALAAIPVIVASARDAHEFKERAIKAGAMAFLQKPMDVAELLATIRKALVAA